MQNDYTIAYTVSTTIALPRTVTASTDPQTVDYATHAYHDAAMSWVGVGPESGAFTFAALVAVATAMLAGDAVCVLYSHDGTSTARVLFPNSIGYTADHRMSGVHVVTLPGEGGQPPTRESDPDVQIADHEAQAYYRWQDEMARTPVAVDVAPFDSAGEPLY